MTLPPGLYKSTSFMEINTDLYLDAEHDGEAVWVFQMVSHFLSATSTQVILLNGAKASNIFWQVRYVFAFKVPAELAPSFIFSYCACCISPGTSLI